MFKEVQTIPKTHASSGLNFKGDQGVVLYFVKFSGYFGELYSWNLKDLGHSHIVSGKCGDTSGIPGFGHWQSHLRGHCGWTMFCDLLLGQTSGEAQLLLRFAVPWSSLVRQPAAAQELQWWRVRSLPQFRGDQWGERGAAASQRSRCSSHGGEPGQIHLLAPRMQHELRDALGRRFSYSQSKAPQPVTLYAQWRGSEAWFPSKVERL